jgi:hypothetical protein
MATPKPLIQKLAVFQSDSFNLWMQKTDTTAREVGDLNNISTNLLSELVSTTILSGTVSTLLLPVTKTNVTLVGGSNQIVVNTTSDLHPKMSVSDGGVFILPGTEIVSIINPTTIQINQNISGSPSGTNTLVFSGVPNMLIGSGTTFTTSFIAGDTIRITIAPLNILERRIVSIIDNTRILLDTSFKTPAGDISFTGATYENLRSLNLVSAINHVYDQEVRRGLIRAIAMS